MNRHRILAMAAVGLSATVWAYACGDGATEPPPPDPPRPTTVTVTPATAELAALGATVQLTVEVRDQNGQVMAGATVNWASSATAVAAVDVNGLVTAAGNGSATITAAAGAASGSATLTVAQVVSAVTVSPPADTLVVGDTLRFSAEAADANGHPVEGTELQWASSDTAVAVVDDSGLARGVSAGDGEITATASGVAGGAALTVVAPVPAAVEVTPDTVELTALGATWQLAAEVRDQIGRVMTATVSWSSGDTLVAVVDSAGLVTAVGSGSTAVAATAGTSRGEAVVRVMQSAGSVVVSPSADTIALGDTLRLVAEAFDRNGHAVEGAEHAWSSSDVSVANVDATGLVTGHAEGTATITATAGDASGTSEITVENPDRAVLVALYNATDGQNWANNENWLSDAPLGEWYGVETDASGRVVGLRLVHAEAESVASLGLIGPIPPELGSLTNLRTLNLNASQLRGRIPRELGNLTNLQRLDLARSTLVGPIPGELGNLTNLEVLNLSSNGLSGPIPPQLGNLANLRSLDLFENALTGAIPPEFGNLSNLTRFRAWRNELSGPIPPELGNLTNLEELSLAQNMLTGSIPPELGQLAGLEELWLSENVLTGPIPSELGNLTNLIGLHLWGNNLTGPIPPELGNLSKMEWLVLARNNLTGSIPAELGSLHALEFLSLGDNRLSGRIPSALGNLAELRSLFMHSNSLTGSLPLSFLGLKNLSTLGCRGAVSGACVPATDEFRVWVLEVQARGDVQIAVDMPFCDEIDAEALERLYDAANGAGWTRSDGWLEDENLDRWYGIRTDSIGRVASIDLSGNGLSGHLPDALGHLSGMTELRISDNDLSGRMPLSLTEIPLEEFNHGGTSLCAPDDAGFRSWLNGIPRHSGTPVRCPPLTDREILERFHENTTEDSRVIPGWLTSAPLSDWQGVETDAAGRVVELRLPFRGLRGSLTRELAQLSELTVLDLARNAFVGPIPPEFGDLHRLERLHLGSNQLRARNPERTWAPVGTADPGSRVEYAVRSDPAGAGRPAST